MKYLHIYDLLLVYVKINEKLWNKKRGMEKSISNVLPSQLYDERSIQYNVTPLYRPTTNKSVYEITTIGTYVQYYNITNFHSTPSQKTTIDDVLSPLICRNVSL